MNESEKKPTCLACDATKLREAILEHPDLPLLVFASDDANCGDYSYMSCSNVSCEVGEFLDCQQTIDDCRVYTDRDNFAEDLEDSLYDEHRRWDGSDEEWEQYIEDKICEYDPYWKKCIIVWVSN